MSQPDATGGPGLPRHTGGGLRHARGAARQPPTVLGVLGEALVTAGVLVLLYLGWQVWWNSWVLSAEQTHAATTQSEKWIADAKANGPATPSITPNDVPTRKPATPDYGTPPVMKSVGFAQPFAVLYIPRLGADYKRVIKQSVDEVRVLNDMSSGIGHYEKTQMPGAVGNFAIAGHDTGWGNAFIDIGKLRVGDDIYIQTKDGYYTYKFRNFEFVQPSAVSVIAAVPRHPDVTPKDRVLTITTCNPHYHGAERLITYAAFNSWQPLSAGPPAAIASIVKKGV